MATPRPLQPMPREKARPKLIEMRQEIRRHGRNSAPDMLDLWHETEGKLLSQPLDDGASHPLMRADGKQRHAAADQAIVAIESIGEKIGARVRYRDGVPARSWQRCRTASARSRSDRPRAERWCDTNAVRCRPCWHSCRAAHGVRRSCRPAFEAPILRLPARSSAPAIVPEPSAPASSAALASPYA